MIKNQFKNKFLIITTFIIGIVGATSEVKNLSNKKYFEIVQKILSNKPGNMDIEMLNKRHEQKKN